MSWDQLRLRRKKNRSGQNSKLIPIRAAGPDGPGRSRELPGVWKLGLEVWEELRNRRSREGLPPVSFFRGFIGIIKEW